MKAVLLAAGAGRRLGADRPKVLLEVGGRTLLERHLANLAALGIPVRIVAGFEAARLRDAAPDAEVVENPEYRRGSLLSLAVGLGGLDEDVLLMDGDVLYAPSILRDVSELRRGFALDTRVKPAGEEMMLGIEDGAVRAIRRGTLPGFDLVGEGVGFFKLDRERLGDLREAVDASDPEGDYEAALDRLVAEVGADYVLVGDRPWIEIDFPSDLERAAALPVP